MARSKLPVKRDLTVHRGSNRKILKFRFKGAGDPVEQLTGADLIAVALVADGAIVASLSEGGLTLDSRGFVSWALSEADSLRVRPGAITTYAIERVDPGGARYPVIEGVITGKDYAHVR